MACVVRASWRNSCNQRSCRDSNRRPCEMDFLCQSVCSRSTRCLGLGSRSVFSALSRWCVLTTAHSLSKNWPRDQQRKSPTWRDTLQYNHAHKSTHIKNGLTPISLKFTFTKNGWGAHSPKLDGNPLYYWEMSQNWPVSLFTIGRWAILFKESSTSAFGESKIDFRWMLI